MTLPYLTDDCIYYVLKYLKPHHSTLFNCLLVNRFWCKATVPLLYANPFNNNTNESIILTLILCFNKTEISQLKNQLKLFDINNININDEYKSLFEYPKYLENFDYYLIFRIIFKWLGNLSDRQRDKVYLNFIPTFYHSVLRQCIINIKQLNISLCPLYSENYNWNIWNVQNLTKLISLTLRLDETNDEITSEFLNNIANICLNLKKLEIAPTIVVPIDINKEKLCTIIKKQNNLKEVILSSYCQSFLNNTLLSLEFQKHSLVFIEFKWISFDNISFKSFINLCNLKYLKFFQCSGMISLEQLEVLKYASFKLKWLHFTRNKWNNNDYKFIIPSMIKYLGASLKELILNEFLEILVIENISIYCSNLITLEIEISNSVDSSVFSYFKDLKIRILSIIDYCPFTSLVLKSLADNLSTNIKEVSLCSYVLLYFKDFFENCHDCLEIINLDFRNYILELDLFKIILNYTERSNNSLKFLGLTKSGKVLDGEELILFDQLKAKGVK